MTGDDDVMPVAEVDVFRAAPVADFERFYVDTARRATALAFALTNDWAEAEDLVQEAYAAAYRRWSVVSAYDDPGAWIGRVVRNRSASRWRRVGREVRAMTRLGARRADDEGPATDSTVGDPAFWEAVQRLPVRQREVVALYYVEDRPVDEIASLLGCSEGTVKSHLSRARDALHGLLEDQR